MTRLLIISHETPGQLMSGPAIRYWHLAHALANSTEVTLAVPAPCELTSTAVRIAHFDRTGNQFLSTLLAKTDVVLVAGFLLRKYPILRQTFIPRIVDLYDPFLLENLVIHKHLPTKDQFDRHRFDKAILTEQLKYGDFFLCASEIQRDFWLGWLAATGRLNPANFQFDRTFRRLIDVVPFGISSDTMPSSQIVTKTIFPGVSPADKVVYWGGGLWDWFDPLTAIRAVQKLREKIPNVKLFFAGVNHPNPDVPPMQSVLNARQLSDSLGLTNQAVFFNSWVPYEQRLAYLSAADVGLSLHHNQIETHFAYRTRILDYIWAALPIVLTRGDFLATEVTRHGLGWETDPEDVEGVAQALCTALSETSIARAERQERARNLAQTFHWEKIIEPIKNFCHTPTPAPDRPFLSARQILPSGVMTKIWSSLRSRGLTGLWHDIRLFLSN